MKVQAAKLRELINKIINEEMERLSFAKDHEYGIDVIPSAKKTFFFVRLTSN